MSGKENSSALRRLSLLIVHNAASRFVLADCEILSKHFQTTVRHERSLWKINPFKVWSEVRGYDAVFCWFASWHSFFPVLAARLQRKPSVVVIGGYDVANVPEAGYGSQRNGMRKYLARAVMSLATSLVPFSMAAMGEARRNVGVPQNKLTLAYLGIPNRKSIIESTRQRMALTVGIVCRENLLRKGLLPFVQASRLLPDVRFVHAGPFADDSIQELRGVAGDNVEFLGMVPDQKLAELYDQAGVYVQASLHEGFGMSLAEAMAAGCIPVATRRGSLPELVGDTGIYLEDATPEAVAEAILLAFKEPHSSRVKAQARIHRMFSLERREEALRELLSKVLSSEPLLRVEPGRGGKHLECRLKDSSE